MYIIEATQNIIIMLTYLKSTSRPDPYDLKQQDIRRSLSSKGGELGVKKLLLGKLD